MDGTPRSEPLRLYGSVSDKAPPAWAWVEDRLSVAGTYWVVARNEGHPHPRPVWGIWADHRLHLSIGSPTITRRLTDDPAVTVHLDSGTDVVIMEGMVRGTTADPAVIERYDAKYDWSYDVEHYGPLVTVAPITVIAWRSGGWAGRDGFEATGRWRFD